MNYVNLLGKYVLRGFLDIPYVLQNQKEDTLEILDEDTFYLLQMCNGRIDMDVVFLTRQQREKLQLYVEKGVLKNSEKPDPVSPAQEYKKADNYYLKSIHWSVTGQCNLRCRHCYMSAPDYKYKDLSTDECLNIIDQMEHANVASVSITGGEPFLRKDIWTLLAYIRQKGIVITQIYTNGMLVTEEVLKHLEKLDCFPQFVLSFDGISGHDWLRGSKGAMNKTIEVIRLLKQAGYSVMLETALYEKNIKELLETYELLKQLRIDYWKISLVFPAGEWRGQGTRIISVKELYECYLKLIKRYVADNAPFSIQLDGFFACRRGDVKGWFSPYVKKGMQEDGQNLCCGTCRFHPYLLPDGTLMPCASMTDSEIEGTMPNLKEESISQIYRDTRHPFFKIANMRVREVLNENEACRTCNYRNQCQGGCRAMSILENRGLYGHPQVLCSFFYGGYDVLIKETVEQAGKEVFRMNSREKLEQLLKTNPEAKERLEKLAGLPEEEQLVELHRFEGAYDIQLKQEDFMQDELNEEQLNQVAGGSDPVGIASLIVGILALYPTASGRPATSRFKK